MAVSSSLLVCVFLSALVLFCPLTVVAREPPRRFLTKKYAVVHGRRMAYVEVGKGDPIVFLHGNPTSSYLWRNVMPHLEGQGRLIAPDLIGFGDSDKLPAGDPSRYIVLQHANYLFALLERLGVKRRVTFVIHDWGSALGFLWAFRNRYNRQSVKGIAFMEALVKTATSAENPGVAFFKAMFSPPPNGRDFVLKQNGFIETLIPANILRNLTTAEMNEYRRPFPNAGESRRPMLTFPRQIPVDGSPKNTAQFIDAYSKWMVNAPFPKLLFSATPGALLTGTHLEFARTWSNIEEVAIRGIHYVQEDEPDKIGRSISKWLKKIDKQK